MVRVLLVDDNAALVAGTSKHLQSNGYHVHACVGGAAALALPAVDFDVLVLDYSMPGVNGVEVLRACRARGSTAPAILLSGVADADHRAAALELGFDACVSKGSSLELTATISAVLRRCTPPAGTPAVGEAADSWHLALDETSGAATVNGIRVEVRGVPKRILELLSRARGEVVAADLLQRVGVGTPGTSLKQHVYALRRALDETVPGAGALVESVRGEGYRLVRTRAERPAASATGRQS